MRGWGRATPLTAATEPTVLAPHVNESHWGFHLIHTNKFYPYFFAIKKLHLDCHSIQIHHRVSRAVSSRSLLLSAEMGTNLPAVDLGPGRTAVAVSAGYYHSCALLVRTHSQVGLCRMVQLDPLPRVCRCRTSAAAAHGPPQACRNPESQNLIVHQIEDI